MIHQSPNKTKGPSFLIRGFAPIRALVFKSARSTRGLSFIELVIYLGLTVILLSLLSGILFTILRVQQHQSSGYKLSSELSFVMNVIKTDVRQGQSISVSSSTLTITTGVSSTDPIIINSSAGTIYRKLGSNSQEALTSADVTLDSLTFQEFSGTSTTAVQISIVLTSNPDNPQIKETRSLQSTVSTLE
ncbi:MAG: hypothetical protein Q8Q32_02910 [bacterium]|nr:hypothetical protein [bacterium]